jgi:hypothetical protein
MSTLEILRVREKCWATLGWVLDCLASVSEQ